MRPGNLGDTHFWFGNTNTFGALSSRKRLERERKRQMIEKMRKQIETQRAQKKVQKIKPAQGPQLPPGFKFRQLTKKAPAPKAPTFTYFPSTRRKQKRFCRNNPTHPRCPQAQFMRTTQMLQRQAAERQRKAQAVRNQAAQAVRNQAAQAVRATQQRKLSPPPPSFNPFTAKPAVTKVAIKAKAAAKPAPKTPAKPAFTDKQEAHIRACVNNLRRLIKAGRLTTVPVCGRGECTEEEFRAKCPPPRNI